jgi:predicted aspartyl protease
VKVPYSEEYDPPAPVVAIRLGLPSGGAGVHVMALVDTGADMTVMPVAAVQSLSLPIVGTIRVAGVTGATRATLHAALLEVGGASRLAEVVGLGAEAIIGRDIINHFVLSLDGPGRVLELRGGRRPARRRPKP